MAARSGVPTLLVAPLGDDPDGTAARARLEAEPLDADHLVTVAAATDKSITYVREDGANWIVSSHDAARALEARHIAAFLDGVGKGDAVLLQGNLEAPLIAHGLASAHRRGALAMLNPPSIHYSFAAMLGDVGLLVVNEVEAVELAGGTGDAMAAQSLRRHCAGPAVLTLGGAGAVLIEDDVPAPLPAAATEVVDTTGAGDAVCGTLAAASASGMALCPALIGAMRAAALAVSRPGSQASFPSIGEMRSVMEAT